VRSQERLAVLGMVRGGDLVMCPDPHFRVEAGDRLVCYGSENDAADEESTEEDEERGSIVPLERGRIDSGLRSLLVLGWTRKVPVVFEELCAGGAELQVTVISTLDSAERRQDLEESSPTQPLRVRHVNADYTIPDVLRAHALEQYDAVLLVGSDRLESGAESDARSIIGCEVLKSCLPRSGPKPRIVLELMDPDNARLFEDEDVDVLVSPQLLGRALAQIALVPELCAVYDDLFGAGGAELSVHHVREYGFDGFAPVRFAELREAAARVGHVLLGAQGDGDVMVSMNPSPDTVFVPASGVRVVAAVRAD